MIPLETAGAIKVQNVLFASIEVSIDTLKDLAKGHLCLGCASDRPALPGLLSIPLMHLTCLTFERAHRYRHIVARGTHFVQCITQASTDLFNDSMEEKRGDMKCPRDGSQLATAEIDSVALNKCPECGGLWLDHDGLATVCTLHVDDVEGHIRTQGAASTVEEDRIARYMRCPRCPSGQLQQITYTIMRPVKIDRCAQCLGFWLDKGELDAIVEEKKALDEEFSLGHLRMLLHATSQRQCHQ